MTRVDFYVLAAQTVSDRLAFITRFVEKLHRDGRQVHVHLDDPAQLKQLDQLLWTMRDISFIPHEVSSTAIADCPVTLGMEPYASHDEVLINLARAVPEFFSHFERVAEIIQESGEDIGEARSRYKYYKTRGYKLLTHNIP